MSKQMKKITKDLETLMEDVVGALKKSGTEAGEEAYEALAEAAVALADGARSLVAEVKERSATVAKDAVREARAHPVITAATLALAAAAVAGLLAARRSPGES